MKKFKRFAFATTVATYFLIFIGGLVRVSGAGLGCPDWPTCFGRWFPPTSISQLPPDIDPSQFNFALAWIEYVNRLIGMTVGLLIAVVGVWALVRFRKYPRIVIPSIIAALLVAYQGWQGGQVIESQLASLLVSVHMGVAFVIAALMMYITQQAYYLSHDIPRRVGASDGSLRLYVFVLLIVSIAQVVTGTQVREAVEYVAEAYPLLAPAEWLGRVGSIHLYHSILGVIVTLLTWQVAAKILRRPGAKATPVGQSTLAALMLATAQLVLGIVMIVFGTPPISQLFHLLLSALYIGVMVLLFSAMRYEGSPV